MEDKRKMLQDFVSEVQSTFGTYLKRIILYGSYARGDCKIDSDIDIMILTSLSDAEIKKFENRVYDIAFEYGMRYDVMISVNIKNDEHFNYWLGALPYYDNIKNEGIVLSE